MDGLAICGLCCLRIKRHRKPAPKPVDPTADWPTEQRGDRILSWAVAWARDVLKAMPISEREVWVRNDEWKRKRAFQRNGGESCPGQWGFTDLLR